MSGRTSSPLPVSTARKRGGASRRRRQARSPSVQQRARPSSKGGNRWCGRILQRRRTQCPFANQRLNRTLIPTRAPPTGSRCARMRSPIQTTFLVVLGLPPFPSISTIPQRCRGNVGGEEVVVLDPPFNDLLPYKPFFLAAITPMRPRGLERLGAPAPSGAARFTATASLA